MFSLEFIQNFFYPSSHEVMRLFRNRESGEGIMISQEIARLMGYHSLSEVLVRDDHSIEGLHYILLQGAMLKDFKICLQQSNIPEYQKATRLLLVTETGISFLLSKHCKEKRIRVGEWLLHHVFPTLRDYKSCIYYQKISSLYLQESLCIFVYQGRMGMLDFQLSRILGLQPIDYVVYGCHGYVENVHISLFNSKLYQSLIQEIQELPALPENKIYFFYESGIYRLLSQNNTPSSLLLYRALEREIFPLFRQLGTHWIGIKEEELRSFGQEHDKSSVLTSIMAETKQDWDILSERQKIIGSLEKIQEKLMNFENKSSILWNENRQQMEELEKSQDVLKQELKEQQQILLKALEKLEERIATLGIEKKNSSKEQIFSPSTSILRDICLQLGIYYIDRITPHTVLMRALIEHIHSLETKDIQCFLQEKLGTAPGQNVVWIKDMDYHFWKKE